MRTTFTSFLSLAVLLAAAAPAQTPADNHAMTLMRSFRANKSSVGFGAGVASLRGDQNSRAKPGRTVEATLMGDLRFSDGFVLAKGTVLQGEVTSASNHNRDNPESSLVIDWTAARLPKKAMLPIAVVVRDAAGATPVQGADHTFGQNQLGATSNSGHAGDNNTTMNNSVLMNKQTGMPQVAPGVHMEPAAGHSLHVTSQGEDLVLRDGTKLVVVLFKDLASGSVSR